MTEDQPGWGLGWAVGLRVWVDRGGRAVLGKGRLELLQAIDRCRSISAAARQLGMSYRRAWELVQSVNEAAGEPLVAAAPGGSKGGGASLTPLGRWAVATFGELQDQLHRSAAGILPRLVRGAEPPVLHVAAAVSLEEVLGQLLNDYALRQPAVAVRAVFGASDELAEHLLAGAPADLFLTADARQIDRLWSAGLVLSGSARMLAENTLAAIGPVGQDLPVRKPADLTRTDALRFALAGPDSPLGHYTRAYLDGLGLYEAVAGRAVQVDNSRAVVAAIRAGQADVGLVYGSDAARADDCRLLFRARRLPIPVRYGAALVGRGPATEAAQDLLDFLTSPAAATRFRRCGFLVRTQRTGK